MNFPPIVYLQGKDESEYFRKIQSTVFAKWAY